MSRPLPTWTMTTTQMPATPATRSMVESFLTACSARDLSPKTVSWYAAILHPFSLAVPTFPTTPEPIEAWLASKTSTVSASRKHGYHRALRAFFNWTTRRLRLPNPWDGITMPKNPRTQRSTLPMNLMQRLLNSGLTRRDLAMLAVLIDTGIRADELHNLTWADVGPDFLTVRGKTGTRDVPISQPVRQLLIGLGNRTHIWLTGRKTHLRKFAQRTHSPLSYWGMQSVIRRAMQRVNVNAGPHILRHTFLISVLRGSPAGLPLDSALRCPRLRRRFCVTPRKDRGIMVARRRIRHAPLSLWERARVREAVVAPALLLAKTGRAIGATLLSPLDRLASTRQALGA